MEGGINLYWGLPFFSSYTGEGVKGIKFAGDTEVERIAHTVEGNRKFQANLDRIGLELTI